MTAMSSLLLIALMAAGLAPAPSEPVTTNRLLDELEARLDTTLRELFPDLTFGARTPLP